MKERMKSLNTLLMFIVLIVGAGGFIYGVSALETQMDLLKTGFADHEVVLYACGLMISSLMGILIASYQLVFPIGRTTNK